MKHTTIVFMFLLFSPILLTAQTIYELPFSSKGNIIELTIQNTSNSETFSGDVEVREAPDWIKFSDEQVTISDISAGNEVTAAFQFDVSDNAAIGSEDDIMFSVTEIGGSKWSKIITITVLPPKKFELFQNYPNPFNPVTTISYQLPVRSKVDLRIYNILGEQVSQLVDKVMEPGLHKIEWDASNYSSGMYIYQITSIGNDGAQNVVRKKMLLMK